MPTSFGDFFKANKDLNKFDTKKTFTLKSKTSNGNKLKTKLTLGKGLSIEGSANLGMVKASKIVANTDGHFEVESLINQAMIDLDIGINAKLGSSKWQAKNGEELVVTMGYENNDLAFSMDTDLLKAGSTSSDIELSYAYGNYLIGGSCGLSLPFSLVGGGGAKFGLNDSALGVKYSSGDYTFGAGFSGIHSGFNGAMTLNLLHNASADLTWGAVVSADSLKGDNMSVAVAATTKVDASTDFAFGFDQTGKMNAKYSQAVSSGTKMTYQFSVDANDIAKDQSFGIGMEMSA